MIPFVDDMGPDALIASGEIVGDFSFIAYGDIRLTCFVNGKSGMYTTWF